MADQPQQWGDRTLEVPPQDPWANPSGPHSYGPQTPTPHSGHRSAPQSPSAPTSAPLSPAAPHPFRHGRAAVNPSMPKTEAFTGTHEATGSGWPDSGETQQRHPVSWHLQRLRCGGEWSFAAVLFAFVCWGIWAISSAEKLTGPLLVFALSLLVAVGIFALSRVLGRVVLEKRLGRVRRTARGSHLVAAVFMVGVGVAHLRQTGWVMTAWNWVAGTF